MQIYSGERAQSLKVLRIGPSGVVVGDGGGDGGGGTSRQAGRQVAGGWKNDGHVYARVN